MTHNYLMRSSSQYWKDRCFHRLPKQYHWMRTQPRVCATLTTFYLVCKYLYHISILHVWYPCYCTFLNEHRQFLSQSFPKLSMYYLAMTWAQADTLLPVSCTWFSLQLSACSKSTIHSAYLPLPPSCSSKMPSAYSRTGDFGIFVCMQEIIL